MLIQFVCDIQHCGPIYETQLGFSAQRNDHGSIPGQIIILTEGLGNEHHSGMLGMMEEIRIDDIRFASKQRLLVHHDNKE